MPEISGRPVAGTSPQLISAITPPGDGATAIARSGTAGMLDIVVDGVVAGTAWVAPSLPPGAETVLPPSVARANVVQDVNAAARTNVADVNAAASVVLDYGVPNETDGQASVTEQADATDVIDGVVTRFAWPPEWEPQRQELIRQHALLRQTIETARQEIALAEEMRRADARNVGIGDNHPPGAVELTGPEEIISDALAGADAVLVENLASIRAGAHLLRRTLPALEATGRWLAARGELVVDEFLKQMAKRSVDAITFAGAVKALGGIAVVVTAILGLIAGLFHLLGVAL